MISYPTSKVVFFIGTYVLWIKKQTHYLQMKKAHGSADLTPNAPHKNNIQKDILERLYLNHFFVNASCHIPSKFKNQCLVFCTQICHFNDVTARCCGFKAYKQCTDILYTFERHEVIFSIKYDELISPTHHQETIMKIYSTYVSVYKTYCPMSLK